MDRASSEYRLTMRDIPPHQRPRERLLSHGPEALSSAELLAAVIGSGTRNESVLHLSNRMITEYGLERLSSSGVRQLSGIPGISIAKACSILAAFELGKRAACERHWGTRLIDSPADVAKIMMPRMRSLRKEFFRGVYLDSKKRLLKEELITVGGLNTNSVRPGEVFGPAVREGASALILVHNHPSGDPAPSMDDIRTTKRLAKAGKMIGIELLDHIVIGKNEYCSLREEGVL